MRLLTLTLLPPTSLACAQTPATSSPAPEQPNVVPQAAIPPPPAPVTPPGILPLAGYANGSFFLRDPNDWFVLFPKGRLQVDWYNFLNRGDKPASTTYN